MNLPNKYSKKRIYNKYKKIKYKNVPTTKIIFVNDYSVKSDTLKFTNFLERGLSSVRNQDLKEHIDNLKRDATYFDKNFEGVEVSLQSNADRKKIKRLYEILNLYDKNFNRNDIIYKCTLITSKERGFQLLFTSKNGVKYIQLIDLYHLVIPSRFNRKNENFDIQQEYNLRKKYNKDIKEVLFTKEILKT